MSEYTEALVEAATIHLCAVHDGPWPSLVLLLGSGLDAVAAGLVLHNEVDYQDISGFPRPGVEGHRGRLAFGRLGAAEVAVLFGREHYYERGNAAAMAVALRALRRLGADTLLMTSAVGSLHPGIAPGSLVLIRDHINLMGVNPLIGAGGGENRFVDMTDAYEPALRERLQRSAQALGVALPEGVYACFAGPGFETPAEVRAARTLGADTVGMSVVPETLIARHCGLRVAALSVVTNFAAGSPAALLGHTQTLRAARGAAPRCRALIEHFVADWPAPWNRPAVPDV